MLVSVVVPSHNNPRELEECLGAVLASSPRLAEVIVVDDASTDRTPEVAEAMGVRVLRLERNMGPGAARNRGARHARGEILFFVDADVVVAPGAVDRVSAAFDIDPGLAAVFGSYDTSPRAVEVVSQYRNLLHHFVHQQGRTDASTFWAGCGAVRKDVFLSVGGFDEERFPKASIEDIELGFRLRQAGHRIRLDKALQGTHLKRWTLASLIRTDIACRAVPWARLLLETKQAPDDLNLRWSQRASVGLMGLVVVTAPLGVIRAELWGLALASLAAIVALNRDLYGFFWRQRGARFAIACIPLHLLYYLYGGLSYLFVWLDLRLRMIAGRARRAA